MTNEERDNIKDRVSQDISVLNGSIITLAELIEGDIRSDADDWLAARDSNPSNEINEHTHEKAKQKILILQGVLLKIDSPAFGICIKCKRQIPYERMRAVPSATHCLACG